MISFWRRKTQAPCLLHWNHKNPSVLLCRPIGGFADILFLIHTCLQYAKTYHRTLIIDTELSGFKDSFSYYFELQHPLPTAVLTKFPKELLPILATYHSLQPSLKNKIGFDKFNYNTVYDESSKTYLEADSLLPIRFDLNQDNNSELLIYHHSDGFCAEDITTLGMFSYFNVLPEISNIIYHRIKHIVSGNEYEAIHIRSTDYKTDYKEFYKKIKPQISKPIILICSDNLNAINDARKYFKEHTVLTTGSYASLDNTKLHGIKTLKVINYHRNVEMLTDLFALSGASKLYVSEVVTLKYEKIEPRLTGFSKIAYHLQKHQGQRAAFFKVKN
ncbi:MAG: hypothetical protein QM538_05325 [Methylacidiphilales bacterium]|nr:hypothetical protein [Candidatus Methylacidiphilales bacterium]